MPQRASTHESSPPCSPISMPNTATRAAQVMPSVGAAMRSMPHDRKSPTRSARRDREIIFTSGATESNNLAIRKVRSSARRKGKPYCQRCTEHKIILVSANGSVGDVEVTLVPVETLSNRRPRVALIHVHLCRGPFATRHDARQRHARQ